MTKSKKILIAKVTAPHGIKGDLKIVAFCDDLSELEALTLWNKDNEEIDLSINKGSKAADKRTKNGDLMATVKIAGIDDRNKSEAARGMEIFASREEFGEIEDEDVFYITDLIGMNVINEGKNIGKVLNVQDFGAGTMLEVEFLNDKAPKGYEKIENIAFKDEFFPEVNLNKRFVVMADVEVIQSKS
mgnify:CR=1 FL=1